MDSAKVQAIIRYRDEVGPFRSVEELEEVKGIGPNTVKRNKARVSVTNPKGRGLIGVCQRVCAQ